MCAESIITNEKYKEIIQINEKQIRKVIIEFSLLSNQISKIKTKKTYYANYITLISLNLRNATGLKRRAKYFSILIESIKRMH